MKIKSSNFEPKRLKKINRDLKMLEEISFNPKIELPEIKEKREGLFTRLKRGFAKLFKKG